jgi:hypothetical protein
MMNNSKMREFHVPFIHILAIVGLVTIVSMVSTRYFINYYFQSTIPTPSIQYTDSQIKVD